MSGREHAPEVQKMSRQVSAPDIVCRTITTVLGASFC